MGQTEFDELLERLKEGAAKGLPKALGVNFTKMEKGYVEAEIAIREQHTNIYGIVHGGTLYTLADTASGFATRTYGVRVVTTNGSMNYLAAGKDTSKIVCHARVVKCGRSIAVVSADVFDDKEKLLANASFTFCVLDQ